MGLLASLLIGISTVIFPGFTLAYALLGKTKLHLFEIAVIGVIFGLIFPPTLTWFESYFMDYIHAFTFSAGLFEANAVVLTLLGIGLMWYQGLLPGIGAKAKGAEKAEERISKEERKKILHELRDQAEMLGIDMKIMREHEAEEKELEMKHMREMETLKDASPEEKERIRRLHEREEEEMLIAHEKEERLLLEPKEKEKKKEDMRLTWAILSFLMILTFATRIANIGVSPTYFEFDPYFDMLSTESILVFGYQYLHDFSAWPTIVNGTYHRMEPLIPYLEAFWYSISNPPKNAISTTLISYVSSIYPPVTAALLVFVVFMFLYHEYGKVPALFGASLASGMSVLVSTFISGEQLLEPWGIFSMFFFYAAYLLAINNKKEWRFAVLAGIAFVSTFLGAHYFTVNAGVLALYILMQGVLDVLKGKEMKDFYKMNAIVIGIIAIGYLLFNPYKSTLYHRIPSVAGIPVIVSFPLLAFIIVALFEYVPKALERRRIIRKAGKSTYYAWLALLLLLALVAVFATPLGKPVKQYIALSLHFTTPSIPLFMTVQEYEPTGPGFNFAAGGFGIIGINAIVWLVLIAFVVLSIAAIFYRDSNSSMLSLWIVLPLAFAAMVEVKYLPHFGVAYIIALSMIVGEVLLLIKDKKKYIKPIYAILALIVLAEVVPTYYNVFSASVSNCSQIARSNNFLGLDMFCNQVPGFWLNATAWMRQNVGPFGARILAWWDYGDWINWFGNSNAVLRGDNAVPTLDYQTAARFVLGTKDGFGPAALAKFANSVQAKYVLFDNALTQKWGALDFLACIDVNQTSMAYAEAAGKAVGAPYELGTSQCELEHDPAILLIPANLSNIGSYCAPIKQLKNETLIKGFLVVNNTLTNTTYCVPYTKEQAVRLYYPNGTLSNAVLSLTNQTYEGVMKVGGIPMLAFMLLYLPNANGTINAPTLFYQSTYYQGFYLGHLPGFTMVYPTNFTGINYVNGTWPIVIYELDNFTGTLPGHTQKPPWVHNNFTMPG